MASTVPKAQKRLRPRVLLVMLGAFAVLLVLGYLFVPWRTWAGEPVIEFRACAVHPEAKDETMPHGAVFVRVEVTNWSWAERHYALKFAAKDASGNVVGRSDLSYVAKVPARSTLTSGDQLIRLTAEPGNVDCTLAEVAEIDRQQRSK